MNKNVFENYFFLLHVLDGSPLYIQSVWQRTTTRIFFVLCTLRTVVRVIEYRDGCSKMRKCRESLKVTSHHSRQVYHHDNINKQWSPIIVHVNHNHISEKIILIQCWIPNTFILKGPTSRYIIISIMIVIWRPLKQDGNRSREVPCDHWSVEQRLDTQVGNHEHKHNPHSYGTV